MIYCLMYTSDSTIEPGDRDNQIARIGAVASERNALQDITGMLLVQQDSFLQILEGEKSRVTELFEQIKLDPRHTNVRLLKTSTENRAFEHWSMMLFGDNLPLAVG